MREPDVVRNAFLPLAEGEEPLHLMYKKQLHSFWAPEEVDMSNDHAHFMELSADQQHFLAATLAFFASSDVLVGVNIQENFCNDVKQYPSAQHFYTIQGGIENVHSECYSLMIDTIVKDKTQKRKLYNAIKEIPCIKRKAAWLQQYMDPQRNSFVRRLLGFILFEGVAFASSFCSIFWVRDMFPGKLSGLTQSNELISRDESLHAAFGVLLYNRYIKHRLTDAEVHEVVDSLIKVEDEFVRYALPVSLIGMDPDDMMKYIKYCADSILHQMGHKRLYNVQECPLDFMKSIDMQNKTNFFEARANEYSKADLTQHDDDGDDDEDF